MKSLLEAIDDHRLRHDGCQCQCQSDYRVRGVALDELADAYAAALTARGAIDFPGMLLAFYDLLARDEWVLEHFRTLYRDILVDEGQDLTRTQAYLLRRLAGDRLNLFVVADDKQSIRGYAGGGFSHAQELVPEAALAPLHLRHNFRCAARILDAAEAVLRPIANGGRRVLSPENTPPGKVTVVPMPSPEVEADRIVSWICELIKSGLSIDTVANGEDASIVPEDIAVFGRTRWTLAPVVEALTRAGIEVVVQTEAKVFLPEPEARLFADCLAFGVNRNDLPAVRRAVDELRELSSSDAGLPADPLEALDSVASDALNAVAHLVKRGLEGSAGFEDAMEEVADVGNRHGWSEGAATLSEAWQDYRAMTTIHDRTPEGFLAHLARVQRTRPTDSGVRMLTIDRAKGLEFKAVALVGARDGLIPHYRATSASEQKEERRRLYVAMTRAFRELLVTWPTTTVDRYGRTHSQAPSRFIAEAGLLETGVTST